MQQKRAGSGRQKADSGTAPLASGERLMPGEPDGRPAGHQAGKATRDRIRQAENDISDGLKDTDLHGTPSDLPEPAPDSQRASGARPVGTHGMVRRRK